MLDIKYIRDKPDEVKEFLKNRNYDTSIVDQVLELDSMLKNMKLKTDRLKSKYNTVNKEIGMMKMGKISVDEFLEHVANLIDYFEEVVVNDI